MDDDDDDDAHQSYDDDDDDDGADYTDENNSSTGYRPGLNSDMISEIMIMIKMTITMMIKPAMTTLTTSGLRSDTSL